MKPVKILEEKGLGRENGGGGGIEKYKRTGCWRRGGGLGRNTLLAQVTACPQT